MIGALISLVSLNLTLALVQAGQVAKTFPVTGATATTPIQLTSEAHGIPLARVAHGVVTGIVGTTEANGLWVLTPLDPNTLSLSLFTAQGLVTNSVGVHAYVSGGQIQVAFPDYQILLGREMYNLASAVASPRIVFIPTDGRKWDFDAYGGANPNILPADSPNVQGSLEQQAMTTLPQVWTSFPTFEVYVTASANPPQPNFGDLDAVQALTDALFVVLFDAIGSARAQLLHESWPSQTEKAAAATQRGQQWKGILQLEHPVTRAPLSFVPSGVSLVETVFPANPLVPEDETTITIG